MRYIDKYREMTLKKEKMILNLCQFPASICQKTRQNRKKAIVVCKYKIKYEYIMNFSRTKQRNKSFLAIIG